jgi:hypothetical protein
MGRVGLLVLCGVLFAGNATAMTGNEWKALSPTSRTAYVLGVMDAWGMLDMAVKATIQPEGISSMFTKLIRCAEKGMSYGQVISIVEKYIEGHPSQWHHDMAGLIWVAMNGACAQLEKKGQ